MVQVNHNNDIAAKTPDPKFVHESVLVLTRRHAQEAKRLPFACLGRNKNVKPRYRTKTAAY